MCVLPEATPNRGNLSFVTLFFCIYNKQINDENGSIPLYTYIFKDMIELLLETRGWWPNILISILIPPHYLHFMM